MFMTAGWFRRCLRSKVLKNSGSMLLGQGLRLLIQAVYFVLMARSLGPQQYGAFVAVVAMAAIVAPFVGVGSGNLIIKNVARDKRLLDECWGNALFLTLCSGVVGAVLVIGVCRIVLPESISLAVAVWVAVSDLVFTPLVTLAGCAFQALERLADTARLNVLISLAKLIGLVVVVAKVAHPDALVWSEAYLCASVVAGFAAIWSFSRNVGKLKLSLARVRGELREGFYFATGISAQTIYNDIDKSMLARMGTLEATGIYAAAYRLIDIAFLPVWSLLAATYPTFFRAGSHGVQGALSYAKRLLPPAIAYSVLSFILLLALAPVVPHILGHEYVATVAALRWLALLPVVKSVQYLASNALTGSGLQGTRCFLQISVAAFNVLANLWLIPAFSWRGAAWSSILSDGILAAAVWAAAVLIGDRESETHIASMSAIAQ